MKKLTVTTALSLILALAMYAQNYSVAPNSTMTITGTSNLHDWETVVTTIKGYAVFNLESDGAVLIESANLTFPVNSIQSEKGKKMDNLTYEALNAETYPEIKFKLTQARINETADGRKADVDGMLTINGQTKSVHFVADAANNTGLAWKGVVPLKMTTYGIDPPTALLGALKTGDDIEIHFELNFTEQ